MGIKGSIVGEYFNVDVDKSNSLPIPPEKKLDGWFAGEVLESKYYNYIFNQLDGNIGQLEQKALQVTYNQFPNRLFYLLGSQLTDFVSGRQPTDYSNNMTIIPIDQNFSKINETNLKVTVGPYCIDLDSTTDKLEYTDLLPSGNYVYISSIANNAGGASTSSDVFIVIKNGGTFSKYKNGVADTFNFTESNDIAQIINGLYTSNQYRISNLSIIDFDGSDFDDGGGGINLQTVQFVSSIKNRFEIEFEGEEGNVPFSVTKRDSEGNLNLREGDLPSASNTEKGIMKVLNVLNSTDIASALSASQGKVLNEKIDAIPSIPPASSTVAGIMKVLNVLNSTDIASALSASQGKVLNEKIDGINESLDEIALPYSGSIGVGNITLNESMDNYRNISFETTYGTDLIKITDFRVEIFKTSSVSRKIRINNSSDLVPREMDLHYVDPTTIAITYAENTLLKNVRFYNKKEIVQ